MMPDQIHKAGDKTLLNMRGQGASGLSKRFTFSRRLEMTDKNSRKRAK